MKGTPLHAAFVDCRLKQIFQTSKAFGGISILVFGDFNQLSPVGDRYIFQHHIKDLYGDIIGNPLWNLFTSFQLQEIMRQKDDATFAKVLNNLANNSLSHEELNLFQSRVISNEDDIPDNAINLFRTNMDVNSYNSRIINKDSKKQIANASDKVTGNVSDKMKEKLSNLCQTSDANGAKGLPYTLLLSIGIKYMLTVNIDVEDGLVNGAVGILKGYEKDSEERIFRLWLDFSDEQVGKKRRKEIKKDNQLNWTVIDRISKNIQPLKTLINIIRKQFPIIPAEAITIYKSQGGTYNKIVVHLINGMKKNELYVAFSRCTKLDGLYLVGNLKIPSTQNSNDKIQMEIKRILHNS
ncbi:GSCOCG00011492001-RA-CDS, partial [Cotesia congregata]